MTSHLKNRDKDGDQSTIYLLKDYFTKLMDDKLNVVRQKILDIFTHILDLSNKKGGNMKIQKLINPSFFLKLYNKKVKDDNRSSSIILKAVAVNEVKSKDVSPIRISVMEIPEEIPQSSSQPNEQIFTKPVRNSTKSKKNIFDFSNTQVESYLEGRSSSPWVMVTNTKTDAEKCKNLP